MKIRTIAMMVAGTLCSMVGGAQARGFSHQVNIKPVRGFIEHSLVNKAAGTINLGAALDKSTDVGPNKAISKQAYTKALQSASGFRGFGMGDPTMHVVKMGEQNLVVTRVIEKDWGKPGQPLRYSRFVARSAKAGLVVARGYVEKGALVFTRTHNERDAATPAERNAAR